MKTLVWCQGILAVATLLTIFFILLIVPYLNNKKLQNVKQQLHPNLQEAFANRHLPHAIIIGVRKGGTRALLEYLNLHPKISICNRETKFFSLYYSLGFDYYRSLMPKTRDGQLTIEKTPGYFTHEAAPERIYQFNPNIKLLLIVREPVVRLISDYSMNKRVLKEGSYPSFRHMVFSRSGAVSLRDEAVMTSIYYKHMMRWLQFFNLNNIHIVDGDKLISDPLSELHKVETFLNISHSLSEKNIYFDDEKGFYCLRNGTSSRCLGRGKGQVHEPVPSSLLKKLRQFYKSTNRLFFMLIGRTFDW